MLAGQSVGTAPSKTAFDYAQRWPNTEHAELKDQERKPELTVSEHEISATEKRSGSRTAPIEEQNSDSKHLAKVEESVTNDSQPQRLGNACQQPKAADGN